MTDQSLSGLKVLVVENDHLNSEALRCLLETYGARVIGPVTDVDEAFNILLLSMPHIALVDYRLDYGTCEPVIEALKARGLPYLIVTACSRRLLPDSIAQEKIITKPFAFDELITAIRGTLDERGRKAMQAAASRRGLPGRPQGLIQISTG